MVSFPPKSSIRKQGFPLFSPSILGAHPYLWKHPHIPLHLFTNGVFLVFKSLSQWFCGPTQVHTMQMIIPGTREKESGGCGKEGWLWYQPKRCTIHFRLVEEPTHLKNMLVGTSSPNSGEHKKTFNLKFHHLDLHYMTITVQGWFMPCSIGVHIANESLDLFNDDQGRS